MKVMIVKELMTGDVSPVAMFIFNMEKFYTDAKGGVSDKYEVWQ